MSELLEKLEAQTGRTVRELEPGDLLGPHREHLATLLRRVEESGPRLPTSSQTLHTSAPWSEKRLSAFSELLQSCVRFRKLYGDEPCSPKVIRFLARWMRLNETKTKLVLKRPRGRPRTRDDNDDPNREAAEIAHELRNGRVGRIYETDGQKMTPVEAAVARVNQRRGRLGDPRRCSPVRVRRILQRGLGTYET
jgi:hypothetical protein